MVRKMPKELREVSRYFEFTKDNMDSIVMTDRYRIMQYDFMMNTIEYVHVFENYLNSQPIYVVFNEDQNILIVASFYDVLYVDIVKSVEIDIDNRFLIGDIRSIVNIDKKFYVLANKREKLLGYYLIEIDEGEPLATRPQYLINWKTKLDIGDAALYLLKNTARGTQQLIVAQKSIFINTYNVYVIDLATKRVVYRHESYHLWEASIRGLLLKNYDFIILSKDGQKVMSLGYRNKRDLRDDSGTTWQLHSLDSCRDLLLEPSNNLLFTRKQNEIIISVQEEYQIGEDTNFEDIYKV